MTKRFSALLLAGALAGLPTAAFAQEAPLPPGDAADVHQAHWAGMSAGTIVVTTAILATIVIVAVTSSSSTNSTR
jgi:hypothetical protein